MLPKKNRVDTQEVNKIFKEGEFINSLSLTFKFFIVSGTERKISFITPKSVAKGAVQRNRLRRLGYSVLKNYLNDFPSGVIGVFIFKKYQDNVSILSNEIKNILSKIN